MINADKTGFLRLRETGFLSLLPFVTEEIMKKATAVILAAIMCLTCAQLFSFAAFENTHVNTGDMASDLIAVARTQIGYMEGSLEGTVQGNNDCTKYGEWYGLNYNPWCAMFVSWCAYQAGIPVTVIPRHASCDVGMEWFLNNGRFEFSGAHGGEYVPQIADIVYFGYQYGDEYDATHVGIIYKVDSTNIYVIEGNSSAKVQTVSYKLTSGYVLGFGRPDYSKDPGEDYPTGKYIITASALNVRAEPSSESGSEVLCTLPGGTLIDVIEVENGHWGKINLSVDAIGWVSLYYCARVFTVTFDANGGENPPEDQQKIENQTLILTTDAPKRELFDFLGWALSSDALEPDYKPGGKLYLNSDVVLYAVWRSTGAKTFTVSYDANGGKDPPASQTKIEGVDLILSDKKPERDGFIFAGWSPERTATAAEYQPGDAYVKDESVTLFAVWRPDDYGIDVTAGAGGSYSIVKHGAAVVFSAEADANYCISSVHIDGGPALLISSQKQFSHIFTDSLPHKVELVFGDDATHWEGSVYSDVPDGRWFTAAVEFCYMKRIMNGTSATTFSPDVPVNRASFAVILGKIFTLCGGEIDEINESPFPDVSTDSYYGKYAAWAKSAGIISGNEQGEFRPGDPVTREQLALMLYRLSDAAGIETLPGKDDFADGFSDASSCSAWALEGLAWACGNGLISGNAGMLMPREQATRAQAAQIIYRLVGWN